MITHNILLYDDKILDKNPLNIDQYTKLFDRVKAQLNFNKIIVEKYPLNLIGKLTIERNRLITEKYDKLLIFAIGDPNIISVLWYKIYNKYKHISIFNGKAIILNEPIGLHDIEIKQNNNNLFSAVFCNFQHYNIKTFSEHHGTSSNLTLNYSIT